ncbi:MAG: hypothetical protein IKS23_02280 [Alphaproteobacteria bacterium]|nr:hypothetical protein [Alphaproteobacteria bacterium]
MLKIIIACLFISLCARAAENVEIYGSAQTPFGKPDTAYFSFQEPQEQPVDIIKEEPVAPKEKTPDKSAKILPLNEIHQLSEQNPKPFSISPKAEQNEIENTLYEGANRIYDVQSFPLKDIKTITTPNIDPTISTYPEY